MSSQLERGKKIASILLHITMTETEFSPMAVHHPFFESAFLSDKNGIFNALEDIINFPKKTLFIEVAGEKGLLRALVGRLIKIKPFGLQQGFRAVARFLRLLFRKAG